MFTSSGFRGELNENHNKSIIQHAFNPKNILQVCINEIYSYGKDVVFYSLYQQNLLPEWEYCLIDGMHYPLSKYTK